MRVLGLLAGLVAGASLAALLWHLATGLLPAAGGLMPFDMRPTGYSVAEATRYLEALTDGGRTLIRGPVAFWDTVFPVALSLFLALTCGALGGRLGWLGALAALAYGGADLAENAAVLRLVEGGLPVDPLTVTGASTLTMAKFALLMLACLLYLLARMRGRR